MKRIYAYDHSPLSFGFAQTPERFIVDEIPLRASGAKGNYALLRVQKRDMTTYQLIDVIARAAEIAQREVGYAGLKDKHATTTQYLTVPRNALKRLHKGLRSERIAVLEEHFTASPLKIGALKGNRFRIVLDAVLPQEAGALEKRLRSVAKGGFPNYFGFQRFGRDGESWREGEKLAKEGARLRTPRQRMAVTAYQSYLFNAWLARRVEINTTLRDRSVTEAAKTLKFPAALVDALARQPHPFKLFLGDVMRKGARTYHLAELQKEAEAFANRRTTPTGLLCGAHTPRAKSDARHLEAPFDDDALTALRGDRRDAWVYAEDVSMRYDAAANEATVSFTLPKGVYATVFLEEVKRAVLL